MNEKSLYFFFERMLPVVHKAISTSLQFLLNDNFLILVTRSL